MSMSYGDSSACLSAIGSGHALLEPVCPGYSTRTMRRAFIVWLHTGQQNDFQQVCNYYHRLELLESKMPEEQRSISRLHEYTLVVDTPPSTMFVNKNFPQLYAPGNDAEPDNLKRLLQMRADDCVFNYDGFNAMRIEGNTTGYDIFKASSLVRKYCKDYSKHLTAVYPEFQDFVRKTGMINSVCNLVMYIRNKYLKDEMVLARAMPKDYSYLNIKAGQMPIEKMSFRRLIRECRKQEMLLFSSEFNSPKKSAVNPQDLPTSVRSFIYGI
ncbi:uncharacterized protein LOC111357176 [Spodoptera litura]|uniref:Uncharacterized protein LOC111357176 n=1 Tax=Spodoptera litura TaxID=69820 RepID=A0A9J7ITG0_SPOLT|nr:uncharacterized protein LOC111357176 [Spodoptera litura]